MRRVLYLVSILVFNLVLTFILLEMALRLMPLPTGFRTYLKAVGMISEQQETYVEDPVTGMPTLKPNQRFTLQMMDGDWNVSTVSFPDDSELGLRDDGLDLSAQHKVFACGDSYTFGFGVDDDEVWHEMLEDKYQGTVDIFNLRSIGNSVSDIGDLYPLYKDRFQHDTVFLCIYLGNEFLDNYINLQKPDVELSPIKSGEDRIEGKPRSRQVSLQAAGFGFLRNHSYIARLVKHQFFSHWVNRGYYRLDTKREVYQPEGSPFVFTIDYEENILVRTCERDYSDIMEKGVAAFDEALADFVRLVRDDSRQLYVFVFPFKEQVYWKQWEGKRQRPERYDRFKPNRIVRESLERLQVANYDLTADFINASQNQTLYWPIDSHWNLAGNNLAADLVHQWLAEHSFPE